MKVRSVKFSFLAVIGLSIGFGIVIGGFINAPRAALTALPALPAMQPVVNLAPAVTANSGIRDFADVVANSMDSVVSVTSRDNRNENKDDGEPQNPEDLFRFFFGNPRDEPRTPQRPRIGEGTGFIISDDG